MCKKRREQNVLVRTITEFCVNFINLPRDATTKYDVPFSKQAHPAQSLGLFYCLRKWYRNTVTRWKKMSSATPTASYTFSTISDITIIVVNIFQFHHGQQSKAVEIFEQNWTENVRKKPKYLLNYFCIEHGKLIRGIKLLYWKPLNCCGCHWNGFVCVCVLFVASLQRQ